MSFFRNDRHRKDRLAHRAGLSFVFLFSACLVLAACSTEKAKWTNIQFHNTTCHYNVWWNGNESLKQGLAKLRSTAVDDYTQLLPPENIGTDELARSLNPEFDRAIEKGVKGVQKHSIFVKGVEYVPYIKECYLLTAYATFYKHDFVSTVNTCNILIQQFTGTHAGDEGAVLLARCLTQEKRYDEAEAALDQLVQRLAQGNFSRSQRDKLYIAMVEATVAQEKYKKAVEYIHLAIDASSDKYTKARLNFLLAQIYRQLDKRSVASKYYAEVLRFNPPYVMEFNARLGQASCADLQHTDIQHLERQLDRMLADRKNEEYRDQILFAKGEMYLGVGQPQLACDNYRLSVAAASANPPQRAQSALRMAEVQYELFQNYDLAQRYYDTAFHAIKSDYPGYEKIRRRHEMLSELVSYTRVYTRCDSLLAVAALPEQQRLQLINRKIDSLRIREEQAREQALLDELRNDARAQQNTLIGDWYFYNANTVSKGKETFRQRWGLRGLEDLWCLSNKTSLSSLASIDDETASGGDTATLAADSLKSSPVGQGDPSDPHSVAYYLKDLPTSPHDFDSIDSLTSISLLNAAYIFYDGVGNVPRALENYLRLADNYTYSPEILQAFYMLYRIYDRQGNTPRSNYYRDMVLMGFPDSDFANLIRDNEYYKELIARSRRVENDYEQLYDNYLSHRYHSVVNLADQAEEIYPQNPHINKFRYWKSLALAHMGNTEDAVQLLRQLASLPTTDTIQPLAQAQLYLLLDSKLFVEELDTFEATPSSANADVFPTRSEAVTQQTSTSSPERQLPPEALYYRYRENQQYFVAIVINDRTINAMELQFKIGQFNDRYYSNSGYKVNATLFTDTTQLLTIHRFVSADEAIRYWQHLLAPESPLSEYPESDHSQFPISTQNYATLYNRKDIPAYLAFFQYYYKR
ncbi:MAG: hypothetical protein IJ745_06940 [Bacteroidales bacterium]|nr:hypothetical protein [Bacteroidales bacterium]